MALCLAGCIGVSSGSNIPTVSPQSFKVYVANSGTNDITQFVADANGKLTFFAKYPTGNSPVALADNNYGTLFVANQGDNTITIFAQDQIGRLFPKGTVPVGATPTSLDLKPAQGSTPGQLFCTCLGSNQVYVFSITGNTLTQTQVIPAGHGAVGSVYALDLFVTNIADNTVSAFNQQGAYSPATPATYAVGQAPSRIYSTNHLTNAFITNSGDNTLSSFQVVTTNDSFNVTLVQNKTIATGGTTPSALTSVYGGSALYVANRGSNNIVRIPVDAKGVPSAATLAPTPSGSLPNDLASVGTANGQTALYEVDENGDVRGYIVQADGSLSLLGTYQSQGTSSKAILVTQAGPSFNENPLSFYTTTLASGQVRLPYTQAIQVVGGTQLALVSITAGALPDGLTLAQDINNGAIISGTPTVAGTFNFTLQATDGVTTATKAYSIVIGATGTGGQAQMDFMNGLADPSTLTVNYGNVNLAPSLTQGLMSPITNVPIGSASLYAKTSSVTTTVNQPLTTDAAHRYLCVGVGDSSDGYGLVTQQFPANSVPTGGHVWVTLVQSVNGLTEGQDFYILVNGAPFTSATPVWLGAAPLTSKVIDLGTGVTSVTIIATEPGTPATRTATYTGSVSANTNYAAVLVSPASSAAKFLVAAEPQ